MSTLASYVFQMHKRGVVQGDMEGRNILRANKDGKETFNIIDFGIARLSDDNRKGDFQRTMNWERGKLFDLFMWHVGAVVGFEWLVTAKEEKGSEEWLLFLNNMVGIDTSGNWIDYDENWDAYEDWDDRILQRWKSIKGHNT